MAAGFDYFTVLADMRTGSNFLEANLNAVPGVNCLGEAFNPHFTGKKNGKALLGVTLTDRNEDPFLLLDQIKAQPGLAGFRLFSDHDPRVVSHVLADPGCAKVVLRRDPLESYLSLKIARATGQWRLSDVSHRKTAKVEFDADEFATYRETLSSYYARLERDLQRQGQTAFRLSYSDIGDLEVINGLLGFMGVGEKLDSISRDTKRQNPGSLQDKVTNPEALDRFLQSGSMNEPALAPARPERAAQVRSYVAARDTGVLFQPVDGLENRRIERWLAGLDGAEISELRRGFNQKTLRQWQRQYTTHRSFTVVHHPLERAHDVFCRHILPANGPELADFRVALRDQFGLPLPEGDPGSNYSVAQHHEAFEGFLNFVAQNLSGQTAFRVPLHWELQYEGLRAISMVSPPDLVARSTGLQGDLTHVASAVGARPVSLTEDLQTEQISLSTIYDSGLEKAARAAFRRDYLAFGFGDWSTS